MLAAAVALLSVAAGALAARSTRRTGTGRVEAVLAQTLGLIGMVLDVWHLARSADGCGTGNGRAGAIVAAAIALTGIVLGGLTLIRSQRAGSSATRSARTP